MLKINFLIFINNVNDLLKTLSSIVQNCYKLDSIMFSFVFDINNLEKILEIISFCEIYNIKFNCKSIDNLNTYKSLSELIYIKDYNIFLWNDNTQILTPHWDLILQKELNEKDINNFKAWCIEGKKCLYIPVNLINIRDYFVNLKDIFYWFYEIFIDLNILEKFAKISTDCDKSNKKESPSNLFFSKDNLDLRNIQKYLLRVNLGEKKLKFITKNEKYVNSSTYDILFRYLKKIDSKLESETFKKYKNPDISIIIPTCLREHILTSLVESIYSTVNNINDIEICFILNSDDEKSIEKVSLLRKQYGENIIKYCKMKDKLLYSEMWNYGYENLATGNIIMRANDSILFKTKNWDLLIKDVFQESKDKILICSPLIYGENVTTLDYYPKYFFISREWIDIASFFLPPFFVNNLDCKWIHFIAKKLKRYKQIETFIVEDKIINDQVSQVRNNNIKIYKPEIIYKLKENKRWIQYKNFLVNLKE